MNQPLSGDALSHRATAEYKNMEAFGIDFPIFIAIIMSITSSAHIIFYIKVIRRTKQLEKYNAIIYFHSLKIHRKEKVERKISNTLME